MKQDLEYTNEDFNPTLGTYSLDGWDSVTSSGPGWGRNK